MSTVLEEVLGIKRIERLTERIGGERVAERDAEVAAWRQLPLVERDRAPAGVAPPDRVAVMPDGGRYQLREINANSGKHWHEYKAGVLLELKSPSYPPSSADCSRWRGVNRSRTGRTTVGRLETADEGG